MRRPGEATTPLLPPMRGGADPPLAPASADGGGAGRAMTAARSESGSRARAAHGRSQQQEAAAAMAAARIGRVALHRLSAAYPPAVERQGHGRAVAVRRRLPHPARQANGDGGTCHDVANASEKQHQEEEEQEERGSSSSSPPHALPLALTASGKHQRRRRDVGGAGVAAAAGRSAFVLGAGSTTLAPHAKRAAATTFPRQRELLAFLSEVSVRTEVEALDLRGAKLQPEELAILGRLVASHPTLRELHLGGSGRIDSLSVRCLLEMVSANRAITAVHLDEGCMRAADAAALAEQLEANRRHERGVRRRRWLEEERARYEGAVARLCETVARLVVLQGALRAELEKDEGAQRAEALRRATTHKKNCLLQQRRRRVADVVVERALVIMEQETLFRRRIEAEFIASSLIDCDALERGLRRFEEAQEQRARTAAKAAEKDGWVAARRREKARWEAERAERAAVEAEEADVRLAIDSQQQAAARAAIMREALGEQEEASLREFVRVERERREAAARRRAEEAAREAVERAEKEQQAALARFRQEQRREREKLEGEALAARKRVSSDRAALARLLEASFVIVNQYLAALSRLEHLKGVQVALLSFPPVVSVVCEGCNFSSLQPAVVSGGDAAAGDHQQLLLEGRRRGRSWDSRAEPSQAARSRGAGGAASSVASVAVTLTADTLPATPLSRISELLAEDARAVVGGTVGQLTREYHMGRAEPSLLFRNGHASPPPPPFSTAIGGSGGAYDGATSLSWAAHRASLLHCGGGAAPAGSRRGSGSGVAAPAAADTGASAEPSGAGEDDSVALLESLSIRVLMPSCWERLVGESIVGAARAAALHSRAAAQLRLAAAAFGTAGASPFVDVASSEDQKKFVQCVFDELCGVHAWLDRRAEQVPEAPLPIGTDVAAVLHELTSPLRCSVHARVAAAALGEDQLLFCDAVHAGMCGVSDGRYVVAPSAWSGGGGGGSGGGGSGSINSSGAATTPFAGHLGAAVDDHPLGGGATPRSPSLVAPRSDDSTNVTPRGGNRSPPATSPTSRLSHTAPRSSSLWQRGPSPHSRNARSGTRRATATVWRLPPEEAPLPPEEAAAPHLAFVYDCAPEFLRAGSFIANVSDVAQLAQLRLDNFPMRPRVRHGDAGEKQQQAAARESDSGALQRLSSLRGLALLSARRRGSRAGDAEDSPALEVDLRAVARGLRGLAYRSAASFPTTRVVHITFDIAFPVVKALLCYRDAVAQHQAQHPRVAVDGAGVLAAVLPTPYHAPTAGGANSGGGGGDDGDDGGGVVVAAADSLFTTASMRDSGVVFAKKVVEEEYDDDDDTADTLLPEVSASDERDPLQLPLRSASSTDRSLSFSPRITAAPSPRTPSSQQPTTTTTTTTVTVSTSVAVRVLIVPQPIAIQRGSAQAEYDARIPPDGFPLLPGIRCFDRLVCGMGGEGGSSAPLLPSGKSSRRHPASAAPGKSQEQQRPHRRPQVRDCGPEDSPERTFFDIDVEGATRCSSGTFTVVGPSGRCEGDGAERSLEAEGFSQSPRAFLGYQLVISLQSAAPFDVVCLVTNPQKCIVLDATQSICFYDESRPGAQPEEVFKVLRGALRAHTAVAAPDDALLRALRNDAPPASGSASASASSASRDAALQACRAAVPTSLVLQITSASCDATLLRRFLSRLRFCNPCPLLDVGERTAVVTLYGPPIAAVLRGHLTTAETSQSLKSARQLREQSAGIAPCSLVPLATVTSVINVVGKEPQAELHVPATALPLCRSEDDALFFLRSAAAASALATPPPAPSTACSTTAVAGAVLTSHHGYLDLLASDEGLALPHRTTSSSGGADAAGTVDSAENKNKNKINNNSRGGGGKGEGGMTELTPFEASTPCAAPPPALPVALLAAADPAGPDAAAAVARPFLHAVISKLPPEQRIVGGVISATLTKGSPQGSEALRLWPLLAGPSFSVAPFTLPSGRPCTLVVAGGRRLVGVVLQEEDHHGGDDGTVWGSRGIAATQPEPADLRAQLFATAAVRSLWPILARRHSSAAPSHGCSPYETSLFAPSTSSLDVPALGRSRRSAATRGVSGASSPSASVSSLAHTPRETPLESVFVPDTSSSSNAPGGDIGGGGSTAAPGSPPGARRRIRIELARQGAVTVGDVQALVRGIVLCVDGGLASSDHYDRRVQLSVQLGNSVKSRIFAPDAIECSPRHWNAPLQAEVVVSPAPPLLQRQSPQLVEITDAGAAAQQRTTQPTQLPALGAAVRIGSFDIRDAAGAAGTGVGRAAANAAAANASDVMGGAAFAAEIVAAPCHSDPDGLIFQLQSKGTADERAKLLQRVTAIGKSTRLPGSIPDDPDSPPAADDAVVTARRRDVAALAAAAQQLLCSRVPEVEASAPVAEGAEEGVGIPATSSTAAADRVCEALLRPLLSTSVGAHGRSKSRRTRGRSVVVAPGTPTHQRQADRHGAAPAAAAAPPPPNECNQHDDESCGERGLAQSANAGSDEENDTATRAPRFPNVVDTVASSTSSSNAAIVGVGVGVGGALALGVHDSRPHIPLFSLSLPSPGLAHCALVFLDARFVVVRFHDDAPVRRKDVQAALKLLTFTTAFNGHTAAAGGSAPPSSCQENRHSQQRLRQQHCKSIVVSLCGPLQPVPSRSLVQVDVLSPPPARHLPSQGGAPTLASVAPLRALVLRAEDSWCEQRLGGLPLFPASTTFITLPEVGDDMAACRVVVTIEQQATRLDRLGLITDLTPERLHYVRAHEQHWREYVNGLPLVDGADALEFEKPLAVEKIIGVGGSGKSSLLRFVLDAPSAAPNSASAGLRQHVHLIHASSQRPLARATMHFDRVAGLPCCCKIDFVLFLAQGSANTETSSSLGFNGATAAVQNAVDDRTATPRLLEFLLSLVVFCSAAPANSSEEIRAAAAAEVSAAAAAAGATASGSGSTSPAAGGGGGGVAGKRGSSAVAPPPPPERRVLVRLMTTTRSGRQQVAKLRCVIGVQRNALRLSPAHRLPLRLIPGTKGEEGPEEGRHPGGAAPRPSDVRTPAAGSAAEDAATSTPSLLIPPPTPTAIKHPLVGSVELAQADLGSAFAVGGALSITVRVTTPPIAPPPADGDEAASAPTTSRGGGSRSEDDRNMVGGGGGDGDVPSEVCEEVLLNTDGTPYSLRHATRAGSSNRAVDVGAQEAEMRDAFMLLSSTGRDVIAKVVYFASATRGDRCCHPHRVMQVNMGAAMSKVPLSASAAPSRSGSSRALLASTAQAPCVASPPPPPRHKHVLDVLGMLSYRIACPGACLSDHRSSRSNSISRLGSTRRRQSAAGGGSAAASFAADDGESTHSNSQTTASPLIDLGTTTSEPSLAEPPQQFERQGGGVRGPIAAAAVPLPLVEIEVRDGQCDPLLYLAAALSPSPPQ